MVVSISLSGGVGGWVVVSLSLWGICVWAVASFSSSFSFSHSLLQGGGAVVSFSLSLSPSLLFFIVKVGVFRRWSLFLVL